MAPTKKRSETNGRAARASEHGRERAASLTAEERAVIAASGGEARQAGMTAKQRSALGRKAAKARWNPKRPKK